ncbi:MAG: O-antigen ligase family protein [Verrucomicrobia bacterium]|nr:O-antigen ligase family protein [Verrucomicrobiota bacterium]
MLLRPEISQKDEGRERLNAASFSAEDYFALAMGLLLGLTLWKFGNPVVLDSVVSAPNSLAEAWSETWPPRWAFWLMIPLALSGCGLRLRNQIWWPETRWLWVLPCVWFAWQLVAGVFTVDAWLTRMTLMQFGGCMACYFLGAWFLGTRRRFHLVLAIALAAFAICLVRAVSQKLFEFPEDQRTLLEGQRTGWTNFPPSLIAQFKASGTIIATNGVDMVNPVVLLKYAKGRVHGTLVYPNALAGAVLLLLPVSLALAFDRTRQFRPATRLAAISLTMFLGFGALFWTGSKSGWLIGVLLICVWLLRLNWSARLKWSLIAVVVAGGTFLFAVRFQKYFVTGATSVSARFDYWHAAVQNTVNHPWLGSGPGTFQRPYAQLKAPGSEMARLAHNDYLEQFSDSGVIGGLSYCAWIILLLGRLGRHLWRTADPIEFAVFVGLLGWFVQGVSEFSLFVPALAWLAFTFAGSLLQFQFRSTTSESPASVAVR